MSRASRDKGKRGERELCQILDQRGLPYLREQDGRTQGSDFLVERTYMLEAKRQERLKLLDWHHQVEGNASGHLVPVVAWRPSREPWRASLLLADLLDLIEEAGR